MTENPFTLHLARDEAFCDREQELEDLLTHVRNGESVVLLSARRLGKSSLAGKVLELLEAEDFLTARIDVYPVSSERDFVQRLSDGIIRGIGRGANSTTVGKRLLGLFTRISPRMEITSDGVKASASIDPNVPATIVIDDVLSSLYRYVERQHRRACIVLDEFQEIAALEESKTIEGTLRSFVQEHSSVSFLFLGSRRHILTDMFSDKSRPFYRSSLVYPLGKIPESAFASFIAERFAATGKNCPADVATSIYRSANGFSWYVQGLAMIAWNTTQPGGSCTAQHVEAACQTMLNMQAPEFEATLSALPPGQKAVLKALAAQPSKSLYGADYPLNRQLSPGGIQKALKALVKLDFVEEDQQGVYSVVDPFMARWLALGSADN
jgi:ATP-dependent protease HslVU (ClpYQ) peptidase subunit